MPENSDQEGKPVTLSCPKCGSENDTHNQKCSVCGYAFRAGRPKRDQKD